MDYVMGPAGLRSFYKDLSIALGYENLMDFIKDWNVLLKEERQSLMDNFKMYHKESV